MTAEKTSENEGGRCPCFECKKEGCRSACGALYGWRYASPLGYLHPDKRKVNANDR